MFLKKNKLLGKYELHEFLIGNITQYAPRVKVTIHKPKNLTEEIMELLLYFQIGLLRITKKHLTLLLPPGWFIFKSGDSTYISDALFRIRILILQNEISLFRRYTFGITCDQKGDLSELKCYLIDGGIPIHEIEFNEDFRSNALIDSRNELEAMIGIYQQGCAAFMNEVVPDWTDITSYWDGEDSSEAL